MFNRVGNNCLFPLHFLCTRIDLPPNASKRVYNVPSDIPDILWCLTATLSHTIRIYFNSNSIECIHTTQISFIRKERVNALKWENERSWVKLLKENKDWVEFRRREYTNIRMHETTQRGAANECATIKTYSVLFIHCMQTMAYII